MICEILAIPRRDGIELEDQVKLIINNLEIENGNSIDVLYHLLCMMIAIYKTEGDQENQNKLIFDYSDGLGITVRSDENDMYSVHIEHHYNIIVRLFNMDNLVGIEFQIESDHLTEALEEIKEYDAWVSNISSKFNWDKDSIVARGLGFV